MYAVNKKPNPENVCNAENLEYQEDLIGNGPSSVQESGETGYQVAWSELQPMLGVAGPRVFDANPEGKS